jgi:hypothetical protein
MIRYSWAITGPDSVVLFDAAAKRAVADIHRISSRNWQWHRKTTVLLHGAPSADGEALSILQAKSAVLEGLPNE